MGFGSIVLATMATHSGIRLAWETTDAETAKGFRSRNSSFIERFRDVFEIKFLSTFFVGLQEHRISL